MANGIPATPMAEVRQQSSFRRAAFGMSAAAGVMFFAFSSLRGGVRIGPSSGPQLEAEAAASASATVDNMSFRASVSNEYTRGDAGPSALQYPWRANRTVMEPHREMTVELEGTLLDTSGLAYSASFVYLSGQPSSSVPPDIEMTVSPSAPAKVTLGATGTYRMTVTALDSSSQAVVAEYSADIMCKYVRRELRDLLRDDRERLLKAMEITYRVPTSTGRQLYGSSYQSAGEFIRAHNSLAGKRDCDHMHDGLGFLTLHTALTMQYEQVLQLIDPSVIMHYWDYTIDAERTYGAGGSMETFYNSEVFFDDWFGGVVFDDNTVSSGRFTYLSVDSDSYGLDADVENAYGLLRSPWNSNPTPFLTRCNTTYSVLQSNPPGCEWHFGQMKLTEWIDFGTQIQYRPHGKIHTMIAGVWGADWPSKLKEWRYEEYNNGEALALGGFGYQKDLWRSGLLECPTACGSDTPASQCKCHCPNLEKWIHDEAGPRIMGVADMVDGDKTTNADGEDLSKVFMRLLCNDYDDMAPQMGDLMNSGAPADPIFWPIHPTVDRLWQWRRINGMTNETWPPASQNYVHGGDCKGHSADDITVFKNLFDSDDRFYTNQELYDLMDPREEGTMDAVFAHFRWGHCQDIGYPVDLLPSNFVAKDTGKFTGETADDCDRTDGTAPEGHCPGRRGR